MSTEPKIEEWNKEQHFLSMQSEKKQNRFFLTEDRNYIGSLLIHCRNMGKHLQMAETFLVGTACSLVMKKMLPGLT